MKKQSWGQGQSTVDPTKIDDVFLKQLIQFCHPDRNANTQLGRTIWDRLMLVRKTLDKNPRG